MSEVDNTYIVLRKTADILTIFIALYYKPNGGQQFSITLMHGTHNFSVKYSTCMYVYKSIEIADHP